MYLILGPTSLSGIHLGSGRRNGLLKLSFTAIIRKPDFDRTSFLDVSKLMSLTGSNLLQIVIVSPGLHQTISIRHQERRKFDDTSTLNTTIQVNKLRLAINWHLANWLTDNTVTTDNLTRQH